MGRRGDSHRVVRWLWTSRRPDARLVRLALLPASGLWRGAMAIREAAYRHGWIDKPMLLELARKLGQTPYAEYLKRVADD